MMQPPRQIRATVAMSTSQPYSRCALRIMLEALRVGDDLRRLERVAHVVDEAAADRRR